MKVSREEMIQKGDIVEVDAPMKNNNELLQKCMSYYRSICVFFDVHEDIASISESNDMAYEQVLQMIGKDFVTAANKAAQDKVNIGNDFVFPVTFEFEKGAIKQMFRAYAHPERDFRGATSVPCLTFLYARE